MGLLSNLLNDNSGKKAAGSVSDMEKALASDRWITIHPHGFLQGEGEDETKQYYRRIFIDDDGNIEKGIGKGHNIKDLSKAMKKEKEGAEGKEPGKEKGASGLQTLQDKIKAIIDDGTPYNEEKAQKVGDVMRQELEKNEKFVDLIRRLELVKKYKEVASKADYDIGQNEEYKKAQDALGDYRLQYIKEHWADDSYNINLRKDPEYIRLRNDVERFREKAILEKKNKILGMGVIFKNIRGWINKLLKGWIILFVSDLIFWRCHVDKIFSSFLVLVVLLKFFVFTTGLNL